MHLKVERCSEVVIRSEVFLLIVEHLESSFVLSIEVPCLNVLLVNGLAGSTATGLPRLTAFCLILLCWLIPEATAFGCLCLGAAGVYYLLFG